jgi:predicted nucleic acid-binding protein
MRSGEIRLKTRAPVEAVILMDVGSPALPRSGGRGRCQLASRWCRRASLVTSERAELFAGNSASDLSVQLLAPFREVEVDRAIAERAGRIRREAGIRLPDALIAATALERDLDLASRNTRDFKRVRGLRLRSLN